MTSAIPQTGRDRPGTPPARWRRTLLAAAAAAFATVQAAQAQAVELSADEPILPVPMGLGADPRKAELGRRLFSDTRLSGDNGVACATCHVLPRGGADGLAVSPGLPGHPGITNTPTIFNVALSARLNWDARNRTLEQQVLSVIESPNTMGAQWPDVLRRLSEDTGITAAFGEIYPEGMTRDTVANAIAEYERTLITPNAPFDRYLRGDADAISAEAKAGYRIFKDYGCVSCHQGVNVGGNMVQVFGIFGTPLAARAGADTPGAAQETGISDTQPVFRVPSLRNVAQTDPYFHDGSAETLQDAISVMAFYQLGREISDRESAEIEAFLGSLSGEYRGVPLGD
ncbi:cytochrome-c peroxidase [Poseidonocella sp. HB161398]|uniref:cytochrome-c peroxidase n=1 Tax=Poseidonocella sp. HB161398 TaxID=2320855 RepID=UPI00148640C4|nr:cytochrome c peroxidase [Poseidonocella sp. HB161398]